ncbi:MAG TPA: ribonuclease III [Verrucomicrobiae bacterium]|jgi:ribonuclease-3|nr:ribonuclease III [Verrucomicrobiae bacterium]
MSAIPKSASSLGYQFRDEQLLRLALTHPSVAHESGTATAHNQRLEFLGDAVLGLVLTQKLYEEFPAFEEGPLTKARAKLVNRQALAGRARAVGLGEHLILSRGENASGGRDRSSALADAYEALLGAIFLDGGFEAAREFILKEFSGAFDELTAHPLIENPKGELQELLQSRSVKAPEYQTVQISGSDHDPLFECAVFHDGAELARGQGKSKKTAESAAALVALGTLKR